MRQLFPGLAQVDPFEVYGRLGRLGDRPRVRLNMVSTVDGAAAVEGGSSGLGGPADKELFATLRCLSDVILVGAATMRAEGYGPAHLDDRARNRRQGWGLTLVPPIAVVTRACQLDWNSSFFAEAAERPIVITTSSAAPDDRAQAANVADVVVAGEDGVDLTLAVRALGERGYDNVLAEGGPGIASQLAAADLVDELCVTVAPMLVGGDASRILHGDDLDPPMQLELGHVLEADGYLFLRYVRP
ncbi:MAG: pyrimidine reductase family protein [Acidimicrobiales bacterium]